MAWVGRDPKNHLVSTICHRQGCHPRDQVHQVPKWAKAGLPLLHRGFFNCCRREQINQTLFLPEPHCRRQPEVQVEMELVLHPPSPDPMDLLHYSKEEQNTDAGHGQNCSQETLLPVGERWAAGSQCGEGAKQSYHLVSSHKISDRKRQSEQKLLGSIQVL